MIIWVYSGIILLIIYVLICFYNFRKSILFAIVIKPILDITWDYNFLNIITLSRILSVIFPISLFIGLLFNLDKKPKTKASIFFTIWTFYFTCSTVFTLTRHLIDGLDIYFRVLNAYCAFLVFPVFFKARESELFKAFLLSSIIPIGIIFYQIITGTVWIPRYTMDLLRLVGPYHDSFTNRLYIMHGILASLYFISLNNTTKPLAIIILFSGLGALYKVYSKAGFFIVGLWSCLSSIFVKKVRVILLSIIIFIIGLNLAFHNKILNDILTVYSKEIHYLKGKETKERVFSGRFFIWDEEMKKWEKEVDTWGKLFGYGNPAKYVHNDFLRFLVSNGIVGLLIYSCFLVYVIMSLAYRYLKGPNLVILFATLALFGYLVDSIGLVPSCYPAYNWFVWGLVGCALSEKK